MPEYLAPGVFVEEVSFRQRTIEGVSTSTAGFVGPTRFGPTAGEPELLTSFADFERIYGGLDRLELTTGPSHNYLAHAARAFFEEGGRRLYVSRVYGPPGGGPQGDAGHARWPAENASPPSPPIDWSLLARYPGRDGNRTVTFVFHLGQNILDADSGNPGGVPVLRGAAAYDTVWATGPGTPPTSPPGGGDLYWLDRVFDDASGLFTFRLRQDDPDAASPTFLTLQDVDTVRVLTVSVIAAASGRFGSEQAWESLTFHPEHRRSLSRTFAADPASRLTALTVPLVFDTDLANGAAIADALAAQNSLADRTPVADALADDDASDAARSFQVALAGGIDGDRPGAGDYEGRESATDGSKSGLKALEDVEDISIVAAPGSTFDIGGSYASEGQAIVRQLISHCERLRYRVAVLDSGDGQVVSQVRELRAGIDSTRAALYYPWVRVLDPITEEEIDLPPSGFVAGIWARNDVQFGVHKSPANEVVRLATGFELLINTGPAGGPQPRRHQLSCASSKAGATGSGVRAPRAPIRSGSTSTCAATSPSSSARSTRAPSSRSSRPTATELWANVRRTIEDFLFNEWKSQPPARHQARRGATSSAATGRR